MTCHIPVQICPDFFCFLPTIPLYSFLQLCQVVRLVPGAYLEYKQALLNECRRQGGLRLAQARALIKIDVNKTRKIYDFLIKEGYITKA